MRQPDLPGHFDRLASAYRRLRAADAYSSSLVAAIAEQGRLSGRRVLDVGCGSGDVLRELAGRFRVRGVGVDPSPAMLKVARAEVPSGVSFVQARGEALPFRNGAFERVIMQLVVHLIDRPAALGEMRRVLEPGGRLTITSTDPARVDRFWAARYFPSWVEVERRRFPTGEVLVEALRGAGLEGAGCLRHEVHRTYSREMALAKIRERAFSTFELLPDEEYERGMALAEAGLPEQVSYVLTLLIATADRPGLEG